MKAEAYGTGTIDAYDAERKLAGQQESVANTGADRRLSDSLEAANTAGNGATMNAYNALATGGLSSGARERVAAGGAQNQFAAQQSARLAADRAKQDNAMQLQTGLLGIGSDEAKQRMAERGSVVDATTKDLAAKNQYGQDMYNKKADLQAGFLKSAADQRTAALYANK
jgi:hypothetical protein